MTVQSIGSVARFLMSFSMKSTPKTESNQPEPTMSKPQFTNEELELMIDAIWRRQRCFIAGDRRFKEYGAILEKLRGMLPYRFVIDEFR
jgi:hypothetical protein